MDGVKELLPKVSGSDPTFEFEFCITNMEDITKMATEGGDHAQVVHLLRTADDGESKWKVVVEEDGNRKVI